MAFILRKSEHFPSYHTVSASSVTLHFLFALLFSNFSSTFVNRSRISSVGRALDCRAGGHGFDSRDRTNTQRLKITEKWGYCLCPLKGWTCAWLGWPESSHILLARGQFLLDLVNPLNPNNKIQILICYPCTFSIEVVGRICLSIN